MIFVDTNVFIYAVGAEHPNKPEAREFFADAIASTSPTTACTSAEVLQELLHYYLPEQRHEDLRAALRLVDATTVRVWSLEPQDVHLAHILAESQPELSARDLVHLATVKRRSEISGVKTFDRSLTEAFGR